MTNSRHERLSELFSAAVALAPEQRRALVDRECGEDPELRAELLHLLALDERIDATAPLEASVRQAAGALLEDSASETLDLPPPERERECPQIAGYRVLRCLGRGGAGSVYEAHDERMNRRVALKVLDRPAWLADKPGRRFEREAWIAGKLSHPNIVRVFERGASGGVSYYTMELVERGSLSDVIEDMREHGRSTGLGLAFRSRPYMKWALEQIVLAARALDHAHRQGVVHRDVKPMNLLLGGDPVTLRVADFGIAFDESTSRLTSQGHVLGTPRYMSPEQLRADTASIDRRSDVYSLGVTLFEMLTLEFPFRGNSHEQYMRSVLADEARRPSKINGHVGRDLEIVIRKCLEKDPRDRYASAAELADDLENVLAFRPIRAQPPRPAERVVKWARRKPIHAALVAVLSVLLPTLSVIGIWAVRQQQQLRRESIANLVDRINDLAVDGGSYREIVDVASRILTLDPAHRVALRSRAVARFNLAQSLGEDAEAEHLRSEALLDARRLVELAPGRAGPVRLEASFLRATGHLDDAAALESTADRLELGDEDDLYYRAVLAFEAADYARADELYTEVLTLRERADARSNRAAARQRARRYEEALEDLAILRARRPGSARLSSATGLVLSRMQRHDEAERYLLRATEIDPGDVDSYERLADNSLRWAARLREEGRTERAADKLRQAEEHARRGLAADPGRPMLLVNLGSSLIERYRAGEAEDPDAVLDEAQDRYRRASEASGPEAVLAVSNLCDLLIEIERLDDALPFCRRYIELEPEDAVGYYNLAGLHALAGRKRESLEALRRDLLLGDTDWRTLRDDPWFESLHGDPEFEDVVARMKTAAEAS